MDYTVTTFYKFIPLSREELSQIKVELEQRGNDLGLVGLTLIAEEGVNATMAGKAEEIAQYKIFLTDRFGEMMFKDSPSDMLPFKRFKVKIKPEIVQLQRTDLRPDGTETHLTPEKWDELTAQEDVVMIDVRNWYEAKIGTFKKAINPQTKTFSQFPQWLEKSGLPKEKKIAIFCTGGIRCEKAAVVMKEKGYENIFQLNGGILNYIDKKPQQNFEGECFVFDHRAAVGQDLRPSTRYGLCTTCGNAGDIDQTCVCCSKTYQTCDDCMPSLNLSLCSKDCKYRYMHQKKVPYATRGR